MTKGILSKKEDGTFEYQIINEWQLCPKCNGKGSIATGVVSTEWVFSDTVETCDLCNGKKIISKVNGLPPV